MPDRLFSDPSLAEWYDAFCPWEPHGDSGFYLPLVMSAAAVLDVGCGTGALLHHARAAGHAGRLAGLDPAAAMLDIARSRDDVEWILGTLADVDFDHEFDLVVMTGNAFQVFVTDDELRSSLGAIRDALTSTGRFAFETRNPPAREWERWTPDNAREVADDAGTVMRMEQNVVSAEGQRVRFTLTFTTPAWDRPEVSESTLRFLDVETLNAFLREAGFEIEHQFGDWAREPLTPESLEIVTVARPVTGG